MARLTAAALSKAVPSKSHIRTGRAGEHYAAYLIEKAGLETSRVDGACDLHVTLKSGRVLRVEVKTSSQLTRHGAHAFHRGGSSADMFAFVSMIDAPLVRLLPSEDVKHQMITLRGFNGEQQQADIDWLLSLS